MNIGALMVQSAPAAIAALMSSSAKGLRVLAAAFFVALGSAVAGVSVPFRELGIL